MLSKVKDRVSSAAAAAWLRGVIRKYAELKEFEINSAAGRARLVIRLKGEAEDIVIRVNKYAVTKEDDVHSVVVSQIECSKEWLRLMAVDHVVGKKFKIPSVAARML